MTTFEYKGYNASGRTARGLIEAMDLKEAREKLVHEGIYAGKIGQAGARRLSGWLGKRSCFDDGARAMLYQEHPCCLDRGFL